MIHSLSHIPTFSPFLSFFASFLHFFSTFSPMCSSTSSYSYPSSPYHLPWVMPLPSPLSLPSGILCLFLLLLHHLFLLFLFISFVFLFLPTSRPPSMLSARSLSFPFTAYFFPLLLYRFSFLIFFSLSPHHSLLRSRPYRFAADHSPKQHNNATLPSRNRRTNRAIPPPPTQCNTTQQHNTTRYDTQHNSRTQPARNIEHHETTQHSKSQHTTTTNIITTTH